MTLAIVFSRASAGIAAPLVTVEAHISPGMPLLSIAGLPEATVKESKHRVRSALMNTCFEFPMRRITIIWRRRICLKTAGGLICRLR